MVYPWQWIYHVYPRIYMVYTQRICLVYAWYIHGISFDGYTWYILGYPWISLDIPVFLNPDFSAGPCCWSHAMRTRLWVINSVLLHTPLWQSCQGKRWSTKGPLLCLLPGRGAAAGLAAAASSSLLQQNAVFDTTVFCSSVNLNKLTVLNEF